jgi:hypothetical protein
VWEKLDSDMQKRLKFNPYLSSHTKSQLTMELIKDLNVRTEIMKLPEENRGKNQDIGIDNDIFDKTPET